jgi:hypothetical protein
MMYNKIVFSAHAVNQMFKRGLSRDSIITVIEQGQVIAEYPEDRPYPSKLMIGFLGNLPIHVVIAVEESQRLCVVVTVYVPDPDLWTDGFKSRRKYQ